MRGDFTRSTFRPEKHYAAVLMQQGRVQLDADWNEHVGIQAHLDQTAHGDLIGYCGGPMADAGFNLAVVDGNLEISAGRYYVCGILCENEAPLLITAQPDAPQFDLPTAEGVYLAYLDVWERHVTHLDDPLIREVALGGPDTATRARTVWQVKLLRMADLNGDVSCDSEFTEWTQLTTPPPPATLAARARPGEPSTNPCIIPPGGGFRQLENQLYRVEVHDAGGLGVGTFKWSRDNGSLVAKLEAIVGDELTVSTAGRDAFSSFAPGQWIEVTDDRRELWQLPGTLVQVLEVAGKVLTIDPATATGPLTEADFPQNPQVRRWDSPGRTPITIAGDNDGYLALEGGVEVLFSDSNYRTGDFWSIPARTVTADVEWPQDSMENPIPQPPQGVHHCYCRLGLVEVRAVDDANQLTVLEDCRDLFPPVTELTSLFYVGGDGQEAKPDPANPAQLLPLAPLQAGVARGSEPVEAATVRFSVVEGGGTLQGTGATADVVTGLEGLAICHWTLGPGTGLQRVEATLREGGDGALHLPIRFTATRPRTAGQVPYDHVNCPDLAAAPTVQAAIDLLCQRTSGRDPAIRITTVLGKDRKPFRNDSLVPADRFIEGIVLVCDTAVAPTFDPRSLANPQCFVVLELPYPISPSDRELWRAAPGVLGFQPIILAGNVEANENKISWQPQEATEKWLRGPLFDVVKQLELNEQLNRRLLCRFVAKGNFIWAAEDPESYLDGEVFGIRLRRSTSTDIRLGRLGKPPLGDGSGDGVRGGDFDMWFWLVRE